MRTWVHARRLAGGLTVVLLLAGCSTNIGDGGTQTIGSPPYVEGSGVTKAEARTVNAFHAVSASQGVVVTLAAASTPSVTVTADDNLLSHVTTEVRDGTLAIGIEGSIRTKHQLRVAVAATGIDSIGVGAGATLDTEDLAADGLRVAVTAGSTLHAGGRVADLDLDANTGATADLRNVEAARATVSVSTGSTAFVNAKETVSGSCGTGSTLHVSGGARIAVEADTSSTVKAE